MIYPPFIFFICSSIFQIYITLLKRTKYVSLTFKIP